jgi:adenosylhomocysteine nucleosidase
VSDMVEIGIIAALDREAGPLIEKLADAGREKIASWELWAGSLAGRRVAVSYSGCGKVRAAAATQLMIDRCRPGAIIHYGTAGAIGPEVRPGDVILGEKSLEVDYCERMIPDFPKPLGDPDSTWIAELRATLDESGLSYKTGTIVCQDGDVLDREMKAALWAEYRGLCTCWEGAAVGRVCNLNDIPYIQLRGITDLADDETEATAAFKARVVAISRKVTAYVIRAIESLPTR